jgi:hypothetical protein
MDINNLNQLDYIEERVHPEDEMYLFFTTHPAHRENHLGRISKVVKG